MAKRRTKKQKQKAKHSFEIKWEPGSSKLKFEPSVKSQFRRSDDSLDSEPKLEKKPATTVYIQDLTGIKKNIYRSLLLSSLILVSELVIYLVRR